MILEYLCVYFNVFMQTKLEDFLQLCRKMAFFVDNSFSPSEFRKTTGFWRFLTGRKMLRALASQAEMRCEDADFLLLVCDGPLDRWFGLRGFSEIGWPLFHMPLRGQNDVWEFALCLRCFLRQSLWRF